MAHLELAWPALVLVLAIAGAIVVRIVAAQGDRASRAQRRRAIAEVWRGSRGLEGGRDRVARVASAQHRDEDA